MNDYSRVLTVVFAAGLFLAAPPLQATDVWTGGGGSGDTLWSTAANWDTGVPASGAVVTFGTGGSTATVDVTRTVGGIIFNRTGGFTISSATNIIQASGITTSGSDTYTINSGVGIPGAEPWVIGAGSTLQINGYLYSPGGRNMITRSGTGTLTISGGKQQFVDLTLLAGTTVATNAGWSFDGASQVIVGNNTDPAGTALLRTDTTDVLNANRPTIRASGVLDLNGTSQQLGGFTMSGGSILLPGASLINMPGNPLTLTYLAGSGKTSTISGTGILALYNVEFSAATWYRDFNIADDPAVAEEMVIACELRNGPANGGVGEVRKTGPGTLTLAGSSVYLGATVVSNGTLRVNGTMSSGGGSVSVFSGATLGGTGTINRAVFIRDGGTLSPGVSPGIMTFGSGLTLDSNSSFAVEIASATLYDQAIVTGGVSLSNSVLRVAAPGLSAPVGTQFLILSNVTAGPVLGSFVSAGGLPLSEGSLFLDGGQRWEISYLAGTGANDVMLTLVMPEPATLLLLALGGLVALGTRRTEGRRPRAEGRSQ